MAQKELEVQGLIKRVQQVEQEAAAAASSSTEKRCPSFEGEEALRELSVELRTIHQKKYEQDGQMGALMRALRETEDRCAQLDHDTFRLTEELAQSING